MGVKANQKFIDNPEFDEFFRRGDEPIHGADTLQPVAETLTDDEADSRVVRTPAQVERRARFIRLVSVIMAILSVGSASAFTYKAVQSHRSTSSLAMHGTPIGAPEAQAHAGPVQSEESQVVVAGINPQRDLQVKTGDSQTQAAKADESTTRPPERSEPVPGAAPMPPEPQKPVAAAESPSMPEPQFAIAARPSAEGASNTPQSVHLKPAVPAMAAAKPAAAKPVPAKAAAATIAAAKSATMKPAAAKLAPAKPAVATTAVMKKVGPKPADYHPPTASFSD